MPAAKLTIDTLKDLLREGLTDRQIAERYGMRPESIATRRWRHRLPANRSVRRQHDWTAIAILYSKGSGPAEIGRALGVDSRVVVQILHKMRKRGTLTRVLEEADTEYEV